MVMRKKLKKKKELEKLSKRRNKLFPKMKKIQRNIDMLEAEDSKNLKELEMIRRREKELRSL